MVDSKVPVLAQRFDRARYRALIWSCVLGSLLVGYVFTDFVLGVSLETAYWFTLIYLLLILYLAWQRFDYGMHPTFLLLVTLFVFQGGRFLAHVLSPDIQPFRMNLMVDTPFIVPLEVQKETMLLLLVGALMVFLPANLLHKDAVSHLPSSRFLANVALTVFLVTLPFLLYKNYGYLQFVLQNGGYLAIYTSGGEHLERVGFMTRALSLVCESAFLLYFAVERRRRPLLLVSAIFVGALAVELLIGLRGKVLTTLLVMIYLYKLRFDQRFTPGFVALLLLGFISLAVASEVFRENKTPSLDVASHFFDTQGISILVTSSAVELRDIFAPSILSYLAHQPLIPFTGLDNFATGQRFDNDLSAYLGPEAFARGFGTGSSYIAESYLLGGALGVALVSLLVGLLLHFLSQPKNLPTLVVGFVLIGSLIYLPRSGLLVPFAESLQTLVIIALIAGVAYVLRQTSIRKQRD